MGVADPSRRFQPATCAILRALRDGAIRRQISTLRQASRQNCDLGVAWERSFQIFNAAGVYQMRECHLKFKSLLIS